MPRREPLLFPLFAVLSTLFLSACASRGIQMPESRFLRDLENKVGQIAYIGMDGNVYTINQAGSDHLQITDDVEDLPLDFVMGQRLIAWSPTSNLLAYTDFSPEEWTIQVVEPDPEADVEDLNPVRIFDSDSTYPAYLQWTPSGDTVSFLTQKDPLETGGLPVLLFQTTPADGSGTATTIAEGFPLFFSWEPESSRAVVHIGGSGADNPEARISLVDAAGGFERNFELEPANFQAPAWSPDGTSLLIAIRDIQGRNALVTTSLQGQTRQTVTTFDAAIAFTWSPDSKHVAYITSERTRQGVSGQLHIVDPFDLEEIFVSEENLVNAFFWSPSGEQVVYFTQELGSGDEEGSNRRYGLGLHFLDVEEGEVRHYQIGDAPFIFQPTPLFHKFLLGFDLYQYNATIWSPDEEYIVLPVVLDTQGVILILSVSGNLEPRMLVDGMLAFWSWQE